MLSVFARSYQSELLNSVEAKQPARIAAASTTITFSASLLNRFGDMLISLGGRLKQQSPCPELAHGQA